jgi:hypothetical protein
MQWIITYAPTIIIWLGVGCTLGIYSILYKENKIYRFFEHVYIGLAAGYAIRQAWFNILKPTWWDRMTTEGQWWWFFALPVGLLLYLIYSKKYNWMARITIGFLLGLNAGQQFQQFSGQYYKQITTTFKPIVPQAAHDGFKAVTISGALNNILFLVVLVCVMTYFFFSFEQKNKAVQKTALAGRWMLMIAFGAIFGSTIMARMALFISRVDFLIHDAMATVPGFGWLKK